MDIAVVPDRLSKLKPWQCCNHFPGHQHMLARDRCVIWGWAQAPVKSPTKRGWRSNSIKWHASFPESNQCPSRLVLGLANSQLSDADGLSFGFYPKTWVLPGELDAFRYLSLPQLSPALITACSSSQFDDKGGGKNWFIVKPDGGCQVRSIPDLCLEPSIG